MTLIPFPGRASGIAPMFLVDDVARTAEWYRDHLGFVIGEYFRSDHGSDGDGSEHDRFHPAESEPVFVIIEKDGHTLMLGRTESPGRGVFSLVQFKQYSSDAYLWIDGIEAYFAAVQATGAELELELELQPYALLEFRVIDCDGRHITFGGTPEV